MMPDELAGAIVNSDLKQGLLSPILESELTLC